MLALAPLQMPPSRPIRSPMATSSSPPWAKKALAGDETRELSAESKCAVVVAAEESAAPGSCWSAHGSPNAMAAASSPDDLLGGACAYEAPRNGAERPEEK